ncbi:MAG: GNAT family N-acetyltransferase [Cyanobacteria bacterium]|nr:GNAT family N-acetyltransferase [Cyanobacteriota bacterium]
MTKSYPGVIFRQCVEADLESVQELVNHLYESDPNTPNLHPDVSLTHKELSSKPEKGRLIVFEKSDEIVGYCILIFFWSNEYGGNVIEIDEICIASQWRAFGIGTKLLDWIEKTFSENFSGLSLQVSNKNNAMLKFIEKMGFGESRNRHFIRESRPIDIDSLN